MLKEEKLIIKDYNGLSARTANARNGLYECFDCNKLFRYSSAVKIKFTDFPLECECPKCGNLILHSAPFFNDQGVLKFVDQFIEEIDYFVDLFDKSKSCNFLFSNLTLALYKLKRYDDCIRIGYEEYHRWKVTSTEGKYGFGALIGVQKALRAKGKLLRKNGNVENALKCFLELRELGFATKLDIGIILKLEHELRYKFF